MIPLVRTEELVLMVTIHSSVNVLEISKEQHAKVLLKLFTKIVAFTQTIKPCTYQTVQSSNQLIDTSRICFNRHERLEIEVEYER